MKGWLKKLITKKTYRWVGTAAVALIVCVALLIATRIGSAEEGEPEVITEASLKEIIAVNNLSTFTSVYNGIVAVMNEKKPEKVDYYVSYEAKVNAGLDFTKITSKVDKDTKTVILTLPEIQLFEPVVDIASLEFIFYNEKANGSTVTAEAYKACEKDVTLESQQQTAIYEIAEQNARTALMALVEPFVPGYTLSFA